MRRRRTVQIRREMARTPYIGNDTAYRAMPPIPRSGHVDPTPPITGTKRGRSRSRSRREAGSKRVRHETSSQSATTASTDPSTPGSAKRRHNRRRRHRDPHDGATRPTSVTGVDEPAPGPSARRRSPGPSRRRSRSRSPVRAPAEPQKEQQRVTRATSRQASTRPARDPSPVPSTSRGLAPTPDRPCPTFSDSELVVQVVEAENMDEDEDYNFLGSPSRVISFLDSPTRGREMDTDLQVHATSSDQDI